MPLLQNLKKLSMYFCLVVLLGLVASCGSNKVGVTQSPETTLLPESSKVAVSTEQTWQSYPASLELPSRPNAHLEGVWSQVFDWPVIAIHAALLPDGSVFSFGTPPREEFQYIDLTAMHHDIWDPSKGVQQDAHITQTNNTATNIFCAAQTLLPNGSLMIAGGNLPYKRELNPAITFAGSADLNFYDYQKQEMTLSPLQMTRGRWYPTLVNLPSGDVAVFGGIDENSQPTTEVEVWNNETGWKIIQGLNDSYFEQNWVYPFIFVAPDGQLFSAMSQFAAIDLENESMRMLGSRPSRTGLGFGSAVMYDQGKIMVLGGSDANGALENAELIDINSGTPNWRTTQSMSSKRKFPDTTLLADGSIFVSGGSNTNLNEMTAIVYESEVWNPETETWTTLASANRPRMYHSSALLLADATVLTIGGDRPLEAANFNGEIFYPPYLFKKDGSGELAERPVISSLEEVNYGRTFKLELDKAQTISQVSFIKSSSTTHSWNMSQRFLELDFSQEGSSLTVVAPERPELAPPGHYLVFVFNEEGVPSVASIVPLQNKAARVTVPRKQNHYLNESVSLTIQAQDPANESLTFSAEGLPEGLSINAQTGRISGTTSAVGSFSVTVSVRNASGYEKRIGFDWLVTESDAPKLRLEPIQTKPIAINEEVSYEVLFSGGRDVSFSWSFENESFSDDSTSARASHRFDTAGRYTVRLNASDQTGQEAYLEFIQVVHEPLSETKASSSSSIIYDETRDYVWNVNPDNNSVTVISANNQTKLAEIKVGQSPRALTLLHDEIWVTNKAEGSLSIINANTFEPIETLSVGKASQPYGIVSDTETNTVYVLLEATAELIKINDKTVTQRLALADNPRQLSLTADKKLIVTRYISPLLEGESTGKVDIQQGGAEVFVINTEPLTVEQTLTLRPIFDPLAVINGSGIANYLGAAAISPNGKDIWIPSKQDDITRGSLRDGQNLNFDHTVRSIVSHINLSKPDSSTTLDFDNAGIASAALFNTHGDYLFIALEGSQEVAVVDTLSKRELFRFDTGLAPQGLTLHNNKLYVHNFLERSVSIHDLTSLFEEHQNSIRLDIKISTVDSEILEPEVLLGKQIFYDAKDDRIAKDNYISCASCHNDGGHDGRVWDFTNLGEGLRNTISLIGHGEGHGLLHWSANFDEVQDFEKQLRSLNAGTGFLTDAVFHSDLELPLAQPKAGQSKELDALAAYVASLKSFSISPYRNEDGILTAEAQLGKQAFQAYACANCHNGPQFTDSETQNQHDIGTLKASSGKRLNDTLLGIDTPTLKGLWATAPYLHDGSAATLEDALKAHKNMTITAEDLQSLSHYLRQIDDLETQQNSIFITAKNLNTQELKLDTPENNLTALALSLSSTQATTLTALTVNTRGTGNDAQDIKTLRLYEDSNQNGKIDENDQTLATSAFQEDNGQTTLDINYALGTEAKHLLVKIDLGETQSQAPYSSSITFIAMASLLMGLQRKQKRISLILLIAILLSACGGPKTPSPENNSQGRSYQLSISEIAIQDSQEQVQVVGLPIEGVTINIK